MIAIVNYGSGNIQAIANIYGRLHIPFTIASTPEGLAAADKVVLPGVGAFDQAMNELERSGMREALDQVVIEEKRPVLGLQPGSVSQSERRALEFASGEYQRLAASTIAGSLGMQTHRERLQQKAIWLRRFADQ